MLRYTIELIPFGDFTAKEKLATLVITNNASGTAELGNYNVYLVEKGETFKGRIDSHPRLQHGAAFLVMKAIGACLKGGSGEPEVDNA